MTAVRAADDALLEGLHGLRRIVFWQPIVSPHQRDFLEAVAIGFPGEVVLAAERDLPAERIAQGWMPVPHERVRVVDVSCPAAFESLAAHRGRDSLHVFSGFFSHRIVWRAFRRLADSSARLAMLSEAPELGPWSGGVKRLRGRWLARRWGKRMEFVLGMGNLGQNFFRDVGFPVGTIHAVGYHIPVPSEPWPRGEMDSTGPVRFIAAGQFIHRKGFDLLLAALGGTSPAGWRCDIYGSGPRKGALERQARRCGLGDRVAFHPPLPNALLRQKIASSDWCIAPSRHDGWGIVVNEALIAGTPVICSTGCGAAMLIQTSDAGFVFPAGNVPVLAGMLHGCVAGGKIDARRRQRTHAQAVRTAPETASQAFLEIVARTSPPF